MAKIKTSSELVAKIKQFERQKKIDLSSGEDLSIAIMNLISLEEHFYFTAQKTGKKEYYNWLDRVREIRKQMLEKLVDDPEGEMWCISKHLLASSMRLIEVGTKELRQKKTKEAEKIFNHAYELYNLFWGLNLKVVPLGEVTKINNNAISKNDKSKSPIWGKLNNVIQKVLDCCRE
ncbi:MAG: hypothetical protein AAB942_00025 [Patescibacteria group bacterium]